MDAKHGDSTKKGRIQATEKKYLRAVTGVTITDKVRNVDIIIESVLKYIEGKQLGWWGHEQRMN